MQKSRYIRKRIENNKTRDMHRLVMEEHLGRKLTRFETVHHIDGDGHNNDISNLQVMSLADHARLHYHPIPFHGMLTGNAGKKGSLNATARLTESEVIYLRNAITEGATILSLSKTYGIPPTTLYDIRDGKTWRHLFDVPKSTETEQTYPSEARPTSPTMSMASPPFTRNVAQREIDRIVKETRAEVALCMRIRKDRPRLERTLRELLEIT